MHHINNNETHAQVYCTKQRLWRRTQNSEQIPLPPGASQANTTEVLM